MRIHLKTTANTDLVPFNYQASLVGAFHKWLELNDIHDDISLYSLSWLKGGKKNGNGLHFQKGAYWHISSPNSEILKKVINSIQHDPGINFGMQVNEIIIQETPDFSSEVKFFVDSPVLVKRFSDDKKETQYLYNNPETDRMLTETLKHKLKEAGKDNLEVEVAFDRNYSGAKTKVTTYKGIGNKGSICPVVIKGDPEAIGFAWNVGVGNSTGIGFGALR